MSINKLISIKNPIIDAIDRLRLDQNTMMPLFMVWAEQAEKQIGSIGGLPRLHAVLDIKECYADLPKYTIKVERAILGDHGCECNDLFNNCLTYINNAFTSESTSFLVVDSVSTDGNIQFGGLIDYEIQNNKLVFKTNQYNGQKITIQYKGIKVDCDGFIDVSENHTLAITEYLLYIYKEGDRKRTYTQSEIARHYREWGRLMRESRAEDGKPSETQSIRISEMLHDPYSGIGLELNVRYRY